MKYYICCLPKFLFQFINRSLKCIYFLDRHQYAAESKYREITVVCSEIMVATFIYI